MSASVRSTEERTALGGMLSRRAEVPTEGEAEAATCRRASCEERAVEPGRDGGTGDHVMTDEGKQLLEIPNCLTNWKKSYRRSFRTIRVSCQAIAPQRSATAISWSDVRSVFHQSRQGTSGEASTISSSIKTAFPRSLRSSDQPTRASAARSWVRCWITRRTRSSIGRSSDSEPDSRADCPAPLTRSRSSPVGRWMSNPSGSR
jgi:hypothetical protein